MGGFLQQAEDILEIACSGQTASDYTLVWGRDGALRMLNSDGWTLPALGIEHGARAVFRVERRHDTVRVEGWDGARRCLLQRQCAAYMTWRATGRSNPLGTMPSRISSSSSAGKPPSGNVIATTSQSSDTQRWLISRYSTTSSELFMATRIF